MYSNRANGSKVGVRLESGTTRGDNARGVAYFDRRLPIARQLAESVPELRAAVLEVISHYPTRRNAIETLQFIAMYHKKLQPESTIFGDMNSGKLIRNWHMALVSAHVQLKGAN